jgi:hypothetical protein
MCTVGGGLRFGISMILGFPVVLPGDRPQLAWISLLATSSIPICWVASCSGTGRGGDPVSPERATNQMDTLRGLFLPCFALAGLSFWSFGCADSPADIPCGERRYPTSEELSSDAALRELFAYHRSDVPNWRRKISNEVWSSQRFGFKSGLRYYYDPPKASLSDCPAGVSMILGLPLGAEGKASAESFVSSLSAKAGVDLSPLVSQLEQYMKHEAPTEPFVIAFPSYVAEVSEFCHANGGQFVMVGLFDDWFHERHFGIPQW